MMHRRGTPLPVEDVASGEADLGRQIFALLYHRLQLALRLLPLRSGAVDLVRQLVDLEGARVSKGQPHCREPRLEGQFGPRAVRVEQR